MALKGADISATYQDWVHVNKSGAGLADHAGAEAALYLDDGAGGVDQICGRTAVRNWLDPDPDAAAFDETWEFSTTGNMTQGQLETAGWTFSGCTGVVTKGMLKIASTGTGRAVASIVVSLAGDFDYVFTYTSHIKDQTNSYGNGGIYVADTESDVFYGGYFNPQYDGGADISRNWGGAYSTFTGGSAATLSGNSAPPLGRVARYSGTLYFAAGSAGSASEIGIAVPGGSNGWSSYSASIATTFNRLAISLDDAASVTAAGDCILVPFIRRYL